MPITHGKNAEAYANGFKVSDFFMSIETDATVDTAETTVLNSSNVKTYIPGKIDATLSGEGLFEGTTNGIDAELSRALASSSDILWLIYPEGSAIGGFGYGLKTVQTSYGITAPVDDVVSTTVDGQSVLGRDRVESLKSISVVTANTGVETVDDNTAATTVGGTAYLQKTENVRNLTSAAIQDSNNNTTFAALVSFTASTGVGAERIAVSGEVKRYTRAIWQQAASTLSGEFTIAFNRK